MLESNYLSFAESSLYTRKSERFKVCLSAQVFIVLPRLTGIRTKQCTVVDLSIDGAGLIFSDTIGLPIHYYISIEGFEGRMGCAEVYRADKRIGIKFLQPLNEWRFNAIVGANMRSMTT